MVNTSKSTYDVLYDVNGNVCSIDNRLQDIRIRIVHDLVRDRYNESMTDVNNVNMPIDCQYRT